MDESSNRLNMDKAEIFAALAHPIRLAIIDCVRGGETCVCKIADTVGAGRPNVSRHLALMVKAGVLTSRKQGLWVYYKLRCPCILDFLGCVDSVIRQRHEELAVALQKK